jgi:hypothetical protein
MIAGIVLTSLVPWCVGYGKLVLSRIDQLDTQRSEITAAFDTLEGLNRSTGQAIPSRGTPSEAWMEDEADLIKRCDRLETTPLPPNADNFHTPDPGVRSGPSARQKANSRRPGFGRVGLVLVVAATIRLGSSIKIPKYQYVVV